MFVLCVGAVYQIGGVADSGKIEIERRRGLYEKKIAFSGTADRIERIKINNRTGVLLTAFWAVKG